MGLHPSTSNPSLEELGSVAQAVPVLLTQGLFPGKVTCCLSE